MTWSVGHTELSQMILKFTLSKYWALSPPVARKQLENKWERPNSGKKQVPWLWPVFRALISLLWTCQGHRPQSSGWAVIQAGGGGASRRLGLRSNITLETSFLNPDPEGWVESYGSWRIIRGRYESGWECAEGQMCADGARLQEKKEVESDGVSPRK